MFRLSHCLLVSMGAALLLGPVQADVVHLKNGEVIEGVVMEDSKTGRVEIRSGEGGSVVLPRGEISRIEKKKAPTDEFDARWEQVAKDDLDSLEDLIVWARNHQLQTRARTAARKALEIDSNNDLARKILGFVLFENRWILESELKKKKGLVRFEGEWMTEAAKVRRDGASVTREMEDLFNLVTNENPHIQEYALGKLLAERNPVARELFARYLKDEREAIRWVAVRGLANFPVAGAGDSAARATAQEIHRLSLSEKHEKSLGIYYYTLVRFYPLESRRLAELTAKTSTDLVEKRRCAEILARIEGATR